MDTAPTALQRAAAEVEAHVAALGWDRGPALFALVETARLLQDEPGAAARLGLGSAPAAPDELTPVEQERLPDGPLDEVLAGIAWPAEVAGCAVTQEVVILPPSVREQLGEDAEAAAAAAEHPERREGRLSVAVTRDGHSAAVLRLRGAEGSADEVVTGPDLAPNLAGALLATLAD